jgi:O-antigen/teichoic acid export membrane protein
MKANKISRVAPILLTGINTSIIPLFNLLVSYWVIRYYGTFLWGQFIAYFLWMNIATHIASFGSKEYLLRQFSNDGNHLSEEWSASFNSRLVLLFLFTITIFFFPITIERISYISIWMISKFINQSFEPVIIYQKKYFKSIVSELTGWCFILFSLYKSNSLSLTDLLKIYAIAELLKCLILSLWNYKEVKLRLRFQLDATWIKNAFPLFLIGFAGLLQSRSDQLIATFYLSAKDLSFYQIYISILLLLQSIAYFIIQPYLKNLYRVSIVVIEKLSIKLVGFGAILIPILLLLCSQALEIFYDFKVSKLQLITGYISIVCFFYYIPFIYSLYKIKEEKLVLINNVVFISINLIGLPIIFPNFGIDGAFTLIAVVQIAQAIIYRYQVKKRI